MYVCLSVCVCVCVCVCVDRGGDVAWPGLESAEENMRLIDEVREG